jgi:hypothetical protein
MQIQSSRFAPAAGWSPALDPTWDSDRTLVLLFGAPELADAPAPLQQVVAAFPRSVVIGCSTAGEILGDRLGDHGITAAVVRFEETSLALASAEVAGPADSHAAGTSLARALQRPDLRGV